MISIALTKKVVTNGRISVSQGQWEKHAKTNANVAIKNKIHIKPLFFVPDDIFILFWHKSRTWQ